MRKGRAMIGIKAVLFDADGTLLNSREWCFQYCVKAARKLGLPAPRRQEFLVHWAIPWEEILNKLWPGVDISAFNLAYDAMEKKRVPPVSGAKKALLHLKEGGYFVGLISNRDRSSLNKMMEQAGICLDIFDYVQSINDFEFCKPDPRVFNKALSLLGEKGIVKSRVIYIGDTVLDFQTAKAAGIKFLGVLTGGASKKDFLAAGLDKDSIYKSI